MGSNPREEGHNCPNPECRYVFEFWTQACPKCGWRECGACGKWFKPEHTQFFCPSCDEGKEGDVARRHH